MPAQARESSCLACRTTRTLPDLGRPRNAARVRELESAKRRVLFNLHCVDLPVMPWSDDPQRGMAFDFLESLEGAPPVMTGHASGVITLNVAEADDDYRERNRESLAEPYRTVVGHLRHELGHYYWDRLVRDGPWLEPFRALFGDERADYGAALKRHYAHGPPPDWRQRFISSYAASHPWEDWAESWAHYLHIRSTLETVASYRLDTTSVPLKVTPFGSEALHPRAPEAAGRAFLAWINAWVVLTTVLNETARSMGQPDIYPFVMNQPAVTKLHFVHRVVAGDDPEGDVQAAGDAAGAGLAAMLREIRGIRQDDKSLNRRWFQDEYFDLWTWESAEGALVAFQLCYDKRRDERALSWRRDHGFDHLRVQTGRDRESTAFLQGDGGVFPAVIVSRKLKAAAQPLPALMRRFIFHKVKAYVRGVREMR